MYVYQAWSQCIKYQVYQAWSSVCMCACKVYGPLATYEDCMGTGNTEESNNKSTEII